jgi:hypothetical protein
VAFLHLNCFYPIFTHPTHVPIWFLSKSSHVISTIFGPVIVNTAYKYANVNDETRLSYRGADKSLARNTSRCILFDGENISFDVSLVICINSTNIPPIMIINRIYETQNPLSL